MPRVSVVIATHSRPHLLPRAIESAKLAGTDVEVIVVDDASTDQTAEVCRSFNGIRYIRLERNQGVAGARNIGILASTGEYISFHDDDDIRLPGSLDRQVELLAANPDAGLAYGQIILGDRDCNPTDMIEPAKTPEGDLFWDLLSRCFILCLSVVFRKECIYRVGLLDKGAAGIDDWDLWVRIAELYKVVAVAEPVGIWRVATPSSGQGSSDVAKHLNQIAHHHLTLLHLPRAAAASPSKRNKVRRSFLNNASDWLIWTADAWLKEGIITPARINLLTALRLNPRRALRPWTLQLLATGFFRQYT